MNFKYVFASIVSLFVGIIGTYFVVNNLDNSQIIERTVQEVTIKETDTIAPSVDKVYNAVVTVQNFTASNNLSSFGTGFVYKSDDQFGYILTNNHVISGAKTIKILNNQGDLVEATLLGSDEFADLAVLKIEKKYVLQVATLGNSSDMKLGDTVFTVGTPVDLEYAGTVTKGIISATKRTVSVNLDNGGDYMMDVLQTTAAINPGNSGGPLVNINGEVIGVNTLKLVKDEIEGMGFAIPVEIVNSILERLEKGEAIERPYMGITMINANNTYQLYKYGITLKKEYNTGVVVYEIDSNSASQQAGLKKGDIILKLNDQEVKDSIHFRYVLYKFSVGDKVTISYDRDGETKTAEVTLNKKLAN